MYKLATLGAAAIVAIAGTPAAAQAALGPDASACKAGSDKSAFLVTVSGFKARTGKLRVQLYNDNPSEFLAKGKKLRRVDLPVTASTMPVCIVAPGPGSYAIAVRHDVKGNGSDWNDGAGFSRNPKLSLLNLKPNVNQVAVPVDGGVKRVNVVLQYRQGATIGPVKNAA